MRPHWDFGKSERDARPLGTGGRLGLNGLVDMGPNW